MSMVDYTSNKPMAGVCEPGTMMAWGNVYNTKDSAIIALNNIGQVKVGFILAASGYPLINNNDTIEICTDRVNYKMWWRITDFTTGAVGNWNNNATANPVTNVGGFDITPHVNSTTLLFGCAIVKSGSIDGRLGNNNCVLQSGLLPSGYSYF